MAKALSILDSTRELPWEELDHEKSAPVMWNSDKPAVSMQLLKEAMI